MNYASNIQIIGGSANFVAMQKDFLSKWVTKWVI